LAAAAAEKLHGLADRKSAFKRLNGNIRTTSYANLVSIYPIIEFTPLKRAIFAAICPQFTINLHSSLWRSEMDWKIVTFTVVIGIRQSILYIM